MPAWDRSGERAQTEGQAATVSRVSSAALEVVMPLFRSHSRCVVFMT